MSRIYIGDIRFPVTAQARLTPLAGWSRSFTLTVLEYILAVRPFPLCKKQAQH